MDWTLRWLRDRQYVAYAVGWRRDFDLRNSLVARRRDRRNLGWLSCWPVDVVFLPLLITLHLLILVVEHTQQNGISSTS